MSDTSSEAARVARAWGHVGDALPRSTEDVLDLVIGLITAASEEAEAIRTLQKTLLTRLNMDPTVVHGLTTVANMADTQATAWTSVLNTIETVYGPYLALIRQGVSVPTS